MRQVRISGKALSLLLTIVTLPSPAFSNASLTFGKTYYVVASVANLRDEPRPNAKIIVKLPISTQVEILPKAFEKGWVSVTIKDGNSTGRIGWIVGDLLIDDQPTVEFLLGNYDCTPEKEIEIRSKWIERAQALAPAEPRVLNRLAAFSSSKESVLSGDAVEKKSVSYVGEIYHGDKLPDRCTGYDISATVPPSKEVSGKTLRVTSVTCANTRMFWLSEFVARTSGRGTCCTFETAAGACWRVVDVATFSPLQRDEDELGMPYGFGGMCRYPVDRDKYVLALSIGRWIQEKPSSPLMRGDVSRAWIVSEKVKKLESVLAAKVECIEDQSGRD